ncbi:MAG: hypothetical protein Q9209_002064 [Squamulea sp. 1 TL-2023]
MQSDQLRGVVDPPPGVKADFISPVYHSGGIVPITAIFVTLSTIFLAIRIYTKAHIIKVFGLEDYTIAFAWLFNIATCMICLGKPSSFTIAVPAPRLQSASVQQKYGNGIHIWNITLEKFVIYSRWAAAAPIVYCPAVALAKVAILIFYLRLNPKNSFRYSVFAVLVLTVGYMIALCFAIFFQCRPVAKFWNPFLDGHCVHAYDLYLWNTILNVVTDFLVLLVPIPMLRKLQVGTRQKWVIGLLTCILSAVRTYYIAILLNQLDTSWNVPTSTSLIVAETNLSVICGCIMVLRPFIRRHLPFLMGGESRRGRAAGAAIYDGYQRSETKTKISSSGLSTGGGERKSKCNANVGGLKSWVGGGGQRRMTSDTDSTFVGNGRDGDVELGEQRKVVVGWPLEGGRNGRSGREARSESEENIIEPSVQVPAQGGIVKTVKVDVR